MSNNIAILAGFMTIIGVTVVSGLLFSLPVMWLWNACLVPAVAGLNQLGWLQAWGITILLRLLSRDFSIEKN